MTLGEFETLLQTSFNRTDLETEGWYPKWVNRALKQIQKERSWNCMTAKAEVTVLSGTKAIALPATFKELHSRRPAVFVKDQTNGGVLSPVCVSDRPSAELTLSGVLWPSDWFVGGSAAQEVFIESDADGAWTLNLPANAGSNIVFQVNYFGFLPALSAPGASNFLTTEYEEMCVAKVKEIAFEHVNDPISVDFATLYERHKSKAILDDNRRRYSGRTVRMGG